ncbi:MAG: hypothetical protein WC878_06960 [Candidatus Paceibacterota bacterium]|jgi:hypothetical protein
MKNILLQFNLGRYTDRDKSKWYPHIRRDCAVIFLCGVLLAVLALFLHLFLYLEMKVDGFFSQPPSLQKNTTGVIDRNGLNDVLDSFAEKKERFDEIMSKSVVIADPSTGSVFVPGTKSSPPGNKKTNALLLD